MLDNKSLVVRNAKQMHANGLAVAKIIRELNCEFKSIFYSEQSGDKILICAEGLVTNNKFIVLKIKDSNVDSVCK